MEKSTFTVILKENASSKQVGLEHLHLTYHVNISDLSVIINWLEFKGERRKKITESQKK